MFYISSNLLLFEYAILLLFSYLHGGLILIVIIVLIWYLYSLIQNVTEGIYVMLN